MVTCATRLGPGGQVAGPVHPRRTHRLLLDVEVLAHVCEARHAPIRAAVVGQGAAPVRVGLRGPRQLEVPDQPPHIGSRGLTSAPAAALLATSHHGSVVVVEVDYGWSLSWAGTS